MTLHVEKNYMEKLLTTAKFHKFCLNLQNFIFMNSRKLVLWKVFEISKKNIILMRLLSFIFGIVKHLQIVFLNVIFYRFGC